MNSTLGPDQHTAEQRSSTGTASFMPPAQIFTDPIQPSHPPAASAPTWPSFYPQNDQDISPERVAPADPVSQYTEGFHFLGGFTDNTELFNYPAPDLNNTLLEDATQASFGNDFGDGHNPPGVNELGSTLGDMDQYNNNLLSELMLSNTEQYTDGALSEQGIFNSIHQQQHQQQYQHQYQYQHQHQHQQPQPQQQTMQQQQALPEFSPQALLDTLQSPTMQLLPSDPLEAFSTRNPPYYQPTQDNPTAPVPAPALVAPEAPSGPQQPPLGRTDSSLRRRATRESRPTASCERCRYSCVYPEEMRRHKDSVHNKIRRHHCAVCNVYINDPSGLSKHKKSQKHKQKARHAGVGTARSSAYECPLCRQHGRGAVYSRSDHLKRHFKKNCEYSNRALPEGFFAGPGGMERGRIQVEEAADEAAADEDVADEDAQL